MARICKVCSHPKVDEINKALIECRNLSELSRRFGVSWDSLKRHRELHLPFKLAKAVKAQEAKEIIEAGSLLEQVQSLQQKALSILNKAEAAGQLSVALAGIREARSCLELLAKLEGELQEGSFLRISYIVEILGQEVRDPDTLERISQRLLKTGDRRW